MTRCSVSHCRLSRGRAQCPPAHVVAHGSSPHHPGFQTVILPGSPGMRSIHPHTCALPQPEVGGIQTRIRKKDWQIPLLFSRSFGPHSSYILLTYGEPALASDCRPTGFERELENAEIWRKQWAAFKKRRRMSHRVEGECLRATRSFKPRGLSQRPPACRSSPLWCVGHGV